MNFEKASRLLEKMNRLFKNIESDESMSSIERDLMLNYVRQFYESFLPDDAEGDLDLEPSAKKTPATDKTQSPAPEPPKPPIKEKPDLTPQVTEPTEPPARQDPDKMDELTRRIEENARRAKEKLEQQKDSYQPPKRPAPQPTEPTKKETQVQEAAPENGIDQEAPDEVKELFEFKEARELSEKLSEMPVADLSKAMGLNEKIFTINELFGGNKALYDESIRELNSFETFGQAKKYLIENIARRFDWTNKEKRKKAKIFIKLVRRRYK